MVRGLRLSAKIARPRVLESSIRDAVAKFDAQFGYADGFDDVTEKYRKLIWAKNPPELVSPTALLVREADAKRQLSEEGVPGSALGPGSPPVPEPQPGTPGPVTGPTSSSKPRRFYGSVEIDMVRPVKSFDAILNAVVMELQRTQGAKVKLTLEIQAEANEGFADSEVRRWGWLLVPPSRGIRRRVRDECDPACHRSATRRSSCGPCCVCGKSFGR